MKVPSAPSPPSARKGYATRRLSRDEHPPAMEALERRRLSHPRATPVQARQAAPSSSSFECRYFPGQLRSGVCWRPAYAGPRRPARTTPREGSVSSSETDSEVKRRREEPLDLLPSDEDRIVPD